MNVDESVRLLTEACTDSFCKKPISYKTDLVNKLLYIDKNSKKSKDKNRSVLPTSFRNKSFDSLYNCIDNLNSKLKSDLCDICEASNIISIKEDSNNNKDGSDIIVEVEYDGFTEEQRIELKFGSKTDKNIGLESFDKIFININDDSYFQNNISKIKNNQFKYADKHPCDDNLLIANLKKQINDLYKKTKNKINKKEFKINKNYLIKVIESTGSVDRGNQCVPTHRIKVLFTKNIELPKYNLNGKWFFLKIENSNKPDVARFQIYLSNNKVNVRFYVNCKNNYEYNGYKYRAKCGLNNWNFNVWIKEIK